MPDANTQGLRQPPTEGKGYGTKIVSVSTAEPVITVGDKTGSIALRASPNNSGTVYIGWNGSVTSANGFPLEKGDSISLDLNADTQNIYVIGTAASDEIRWIATN